MSRPFGFGQIPTGALVRDQQFKRGLLGAWLVGRTGIRVAVDSSGRNWPIAESNAVNTNASQGISQFGRTYLNGDAVFDAPWHTPTAVTPPLNVTYCIIARSLEASYPSESAESMMLGGFAQSEAATMPPDGSVGNCSWVLKGPYGFFGDVRIRVEGRFSDTTALAQNLTLAGDSEAAVPDWFAFAFAFADARQSLLAARNLRTGVISLSTFTETKTLNAVSQVFTPFSWKNFAADYSWSEATPDIEVAFASLHARALDPIEIVEWMKAPHAIFDEGVGRFRVSAAAAGGDSASQRLMMMGMS